MNCSRLMTFGLVLGLVACGSQEKVTLEKPKESDVRAAEPADFEDESLFSVSGDESAYDSELAETTAVDTGEDVATDDSDQAEKPQAAEQKPEPKIATELPDKEEPTVEVAKPEKAADKAAMRKLKTDCNMRATASGKGEKIKQIDKGKKIWTEPHNKSWFKVYRSKKVAAYMSKSCF
ncbi:MAG: hypothetical protein AAF202_10080 [Pseudomonadota bacterium]